MTEPPISWYSLDANLATVDHPPVALERALEIVEEYYARATESFDSAEAAVAATMFGFSRSATEFIEFSVHGPAQVAYKFERTDPNAGFFKRIFGGTFQYESNLDSKAAMIERVEEFYAQSSGQIMAKLQRSAG